MTMQPWFTDAKFGIFIHWGIYAVDGVAESWSFYNGKVSHEQYMKQLDGFTASHYDPRAWAKLFARAGAKYAVLTTKHHDGVALWDTAQSDLSVVKRTPAGRDLIAPYAEALREEGLKVGLYFSHSDWNHPDYASIRKGDEATSWTGGNRFSVPPEGEEDPAVWERFLGVREGEIRELLAAHRPDLLWFDGEWERTERQWRMKELRETILSLAPQTILNSRMCGHGDYATPEQALPVAEFPDGPWELCQTVNDSWGYQPKDTNYKSLGRLVRCFAETIGAGGNLLLSIGPKADGTIPAEQVERLEGIGDWIARHADAVYGTRAGLPFGHYYGPSTIAADRRTLYLTCFDIPRELVAVRGLKTPVKRVSVLGTGTELAHRSNQAFADVPGVLEIDAPAAGDLDPHATVLAVELDGEIDLYRGKARQ